jgi:hypothetical protein
VSWLGTAATAVGDVLAAPLGEAATALLLVAAMVFAVLALLLFKWATPQRRLAAARGRLIGRLLEAALYQDDPRVIARVQAGVLVANLRYLVLALPALAALALPLLLVLPQLEARLGRQPLAVGEATLVTAAAPPQVSARLVAPAGLAVEAGPVRDPDRGELVWRVRAIAPGSHRLELVTAAGERLALAVPVARAGLPALTAARHEDSLAQLVFDPAGRPLPASAPVTRLAVALPPRDLRVPAGWLVTFTLLSLAAGLALRRPLRVEL